MDIILQSRQHRTADGGPESVEIPSSNNLNDWPRFDEYDFGNVSIGECNGWMIRFAALQTKAELLLALYGVEIAKSAGQRAKMLRADRAVYQSYQSHYKELAKVLSRRLTSMLEEIRNGLHR